MKKCLYCGKEIQEESIMDFCDSCGVKIWGPKMLATIKKNYGEAKENNDLIHMDASENLKSLRRDLSSGKSNLQNNRNFEK